jgi:hypothetical protein
MGDNDSGVAVEEAELPEKREQQHWECGCLRNGCVQVAA